jgi:hypothetical protein
MRRILTFALLAAFAFGATEAVSLVTAGKAEATQHTVANGNARRGR